MIWIEHVLGPDVDPITDTFEQFFMNPMKSGDDMQLEFDFSGGDEN